MVDVMGQTPEEFEEMLNAQIAEGERKAAALDESWPRSSPLVSLVSTPAVRSRSRSTRRGP